jgi:hypothetical protein
MWRSPEADFETGDRHFGVFTHDWRVEPPQAWLQIKKELVSDTQPPSEPPRTLPLASLTDEQLAEAVRQALRDVGRLDALAKNPLVRTRLVTNQDGPPAERLQRLLGEAVASLKSSPRDLKFHRALWHTYIEPAPTQERAAELLDLPFNTYRYHLGRGIERVCDWFRQREDEARLNGR